MRLNYRGQLPQLADSVFVAPGAVVIGDVTCGEDSSIWYNCVVRGDVMPIRIGARVNIQDLSVVHVTSGTHSTTIEDDVTVGHRAIIHGCVVERGSLIGMGAIVMDGAVVGAGSLVGAGAVVTPGTVIPPRSLAVGSPARVKRELTDAEVEGLLDSATHYVRTAANHRASLEPTR
ncbi:MAG: gamma carbonic anhydrase family protein [Dehalococcoidia bacterium]|nr:gamma carbonic anhydrase family protein [Dehalococcoidia bacterium]MCB9506577.1 gamma carbonic anhydrase family protein [Myxococcales bacterium]